MGKRIFPSNLLEQAASIQDIWSRTDPKLTLGNLSLSALISDIQNLRGAEADLACMENQMNILRNQRDALRQALWDKLKRVRSGFKAIFGDDSAQYDEVGGTRLSDRKSPRRTPRPVE